MKLNGVYVHSDKEPGFFEKEPFKESFHGVFDGKKFTVGYFEFDSKDIEKHKDFLDPNGCILSNNLILKYKNGKFRFRSFTFNGAKRRFRMRRKCITKIEKYKNKYSGINNEIVVNRKMKFLGFERLRYCLGDAAYTLPFALFSPKKTKEKIPLLIYLHGYTNGGESNLIPFFEALPIIFKTKLNIRKHPAFILIPSLPRFEGFPSKEGEGFDKIFTPLLEKLLNEYPIDEKRVYIMGASNGGMGSWTQLGIHPERYAAAIPMMGCIHDSDISVYCEKIKDKPIWAVHAADDMAVGIGENKEFGSFGSDIIVDGLKKNGSKNLRYTRYEKYGHSASGHFIKKENWHKWLFEQSIKREEQK